MTMQYPNPVQAALLFDARFDELDAIARDYARVVEMQTGVVLQTQDHQPGSFIRLIGGANDLTVTFEYSDRPLERALLEETLKSPATTIAAPDMLERIDRSLSTIRVEVSQGSAPILDTPPEIASEIQDEQRTQIAAGADGFSRCLEALALMVRVTADRTTPSAIHWAQSNQLFTPEHFEAHARDGFPGRLTISPLLFGAAFDREDNATSSETGLRTFGARHWIGREILVAPTSLPWRVSYNAVLAFCANAAFETHAPISDGETFSPPSSDQEGGDEVWRVDYQKDSGSERDKDHDHIEAGEPPMVELIPLRHDGCDFISGEYAQSANILCQRTPRKEQSAIEAVTLADEAECDTDTLSELKSALAEGLAEAASSRPDTAAYALASGTPSLPGDIDISGRSLRAKVFGKREV